MRSTKTAKKKSKVVPEKVIQKQILAWLKTTGLLYWRQNSGFMFIGKRMVKLGEAGLPDIMVVIPGGKLVGLEVKSANGKLRPAQIAMREQMWLSGAGYHVVRSVGDAVYAMHTHGQSYGDLR